MNVSKSGSKFRTHRQAYFVHVRWLFLVVRSYTNDISFRFFLAGNVDNVDSTTSCIGSNARVRSREKRKIATDGEERSSERCSVSIFKLRRASICVRRVSPRRIGMCVSRRKEIFQAPYRRSQVYAARDTASLDNSYYIDNSRAD